MTLFDTEEKLAVGIDFVVVVVYNVFHEWRYGR